jgi:DNA-binding NtrC family response regulator
VLAQMEALDLSVPTILCSGYQDPQGAERFIARQPLTFLQKPFNLRQLEDTLAALLAAAKN